MSNLIQAVVVVLIVMLLFLGIRTGLVVASLIPVTMVMTILIMSIVDVGLNKISLASLIIALGMLVDNAIALSPDHTDYCYNHSRFNSTLNRRRHFRGTNGDWDYLRITFCNCSDTAICTSYV